MDKSPQPGQLSELQRKVEIYEEIIKNLNRKIDKDVASKYTKHCAKPAKDFIARMSEPWYFITGQPGF